MTTVDLSPLRIDESASRRPARKPLGPRLFVVFLVLLALAVAATFLWPLLRPIRVVPTAAVRMAAGPGAPVAATAAEAAGWVEPDPFPIHVRPLVQGRLESIAVLEGAVVRAGVTVLAKLISADLQAAHERAAAGERQRAAEREAAAAAHAVAKAQLEQKADPRRAVLAAERALTDVEQRLAGAEGARARAVAEVAGARAAVTAQEELASGGGAYAVALARARANAEAAEATANAAAQQVAALQRELAAAQAELALAQEVLADPVDLAGLVRTTAAAEASAAAAYAAAGVEVAIAARELAWAEVRAPVDGVVLKLLAAPGDEVGPNGNAIVTLYDPQRLQARIDVPLDAVAHVRPGQRVELRSEVLGDRVVGGIVDRVQHESDLLKNTLQVKVRIVEPPPLLRPETLCRARFLADAASGDAGEAPPPVFLVPRAAVRDGAVFVLDPARGRARRVPVERLGEDGGDLVVRGELSVTQRVALAPVEDGESVRSDAP